MKRNRKNSTPVLKRGKKAKSSKKSAAGKWIKRVIYFLSVCLFVGLIACIGIGAGMYAAVTQEIEDMNIHDLALSRSSIVYYTDKDGNAIEADRLVGDENCIWIDSSKIAPVMKDAIVAIEDERFYNHGGVDIKRTTGAVLGYIREKFGGSVASYGGSTITQQVIKNITSEKDRTATRKIKEMMRAVALEKQLSKDEILTMYLNLIYLSNNCYGVEAASNKYFGKSAAELELTEAAMIAGITQRPSYYNPLKNPKNALEKRNTVLLKMYEMEKITKEEYEEAIKKDLGLHVTELSKKDNVYSYFIDAVINEIIEDLQKEKGYTEAFATQQVFSGGLKIYTTMDYDIQKKMEEFYENEANFPAGAAKAQSAMVIIDPQNGEIKGMIGGKGVKTDSRGLNRATQTRRQPGSSIKPLSVYGPAFDQKILTPSSILTDKYIEIPDGDKVWTPENAYNGFKGKMTVKKAIEISANIPAIEALQEVGVDTSFDYVKDKFKINVSDSDRGLSPLALGSLTKGATVEEMAAAYQAFANGGYYHTPHTYTKVVDSANRVLLEKKVESEQIIGEDTSYVMSQMLYGVVNSASGTGKDAKMDNDIAVYGKTGTSNNTYDKWFVGYTPYYVGAVWFGFDIQQSIVNAGISPYISVRIWNSVMEKVHEGLSPREIEMSDELVSVRICTTSGLLATSDCSGSNEYFVSGTEPKKYCNKSHLEESSDETEESEAIEIPSDEEPEVIPLTPPTSRPQVEANPEDDVISLD